MLSVKMILRTPTVSRKSLDIRCAYLSVTVRAYKPVTAACTRFGETDFPM